MAKEKTEAIFAIVDRGFASTVMNIAREAGAKGGTIINARGANSKEASKKYGIVVTPDKELVLMVVDGEIKDDVINAVNKEVRLDKEGHGIIFSIPVGHLSGLKY